MSQFRRASSNNRELLACFPHAVGHGEEGICLLVKMGPHRILLDCGLTGSKLLQAEDKPPAELVFCTHAHSDHARGLLALHEAFPEIPIYASEVTSKLLSLNWLERSPEEIPQFCQPLPWRQPIQLAEDLTGELFPAGHIPGAACIFLTYKTPKRSYKLLYTGDFSVSNFQLVEGLSIESLRGLAPDVLIIEGSYGTARHPHRRQQEKYLMERIREAIAKDTSVLLPVPTLGLGQEILKLLRSHHQFTGRDLDIWVDGSVAKACDIYLELLPQFPASVQNFAKHQPLFWDERICPRMRKLNGASSLAHAPSPCIVLVDRTVDLQQYCDSGSGSWLILIPQHPRVFLSLDSDPLLTLSNSEGISVETYLLAEHSDGRNTTQLIHNIRPQHVIFVHGSPIYLGDLTSLEELQNRYQLHSPAAGTLVELPIGDKFIQPAEPRQTSYEGELNEVGTFISVTLPDIITSDPRWNNFADTGLVEARWQGEELVLRGLSQRELLASGSEAKRIGDVDCCGNCRYYKNQHCLNPASPLYEFKVTPEGYCPVFEPLDSKE
ncbi:MAG: MBL fold metallo-hydrolase [Prochloraceae cyanobacterium]|nr:MBL fold metallo-hydrolase [Prochloraceae cyanobacterium]